MASTGRGCGSILHKRIEFLAAGDFDGDGRVDLAAVGDESYFCILRNIGEGAFGPPISLGGTQKANIVCTADLNGNGTLDLVVSNCVLGGGVVTFLNDGKGGFREGAGPRSTLPAMAQERAVSALGAGLLIPSYLSH